MKCEIYRYSGPDSKQFIDFLFIWKTSELSLCHEGEIEYHRHSSFKRKLNMLYWNKL